VIAAAGLVALAMVDRLRDDHERARRLAEAVAERWPDVGLDLDRVRTNIVVFHHPGAVALLDHLAAEGVLATTVAPGLVRFCVHHDVDDVGLERARKALAAAP
jgi:threonine aldolase